VFSIDGTAATEQPFAICAMTVSVSASAATDARATETTASNPIIGTSNAAGEPCRSAHPRNRTNCHRRNRSSPDDQKRTSRRDSSAQPTRTGLGLRRPARSRVTLNRPLPTARIGAARITTLPVQVVADRAERTTAIVTTNLPFSEWPQVFPNARLCKAMLDRLTDHAHIIETGTDSFRFRRTVAGRRGAKG
jgi:hypothetical protein